MHGIMGVMTKPITIQESCIEVIQDLLNRSNHMDSCALLQPVPEDYWPLCDCGHSDGVESAYDLIAILRGDHP
jgi:hypothetical protein